MIDTQDEVAFSYVRFSRPEQSHGDSLRRQTDGTADWCKRNKVTLDTTLTLRDLGVSAFRGKHRTGDKHALSVFLKAVESGRVPKGSYLVIENLDRLSREDERTALQLWMAILDKGVNIVQLTPETVFRHDKTDMMDIMRALIELSRGHSESRIKSERNGAAWQHKREAAREGKDQPPRKKDGRVTKAITNCLPAWIEDRDGVLQVRPEQAAVVRRIYEMSARGVGAGLICKALMNDGAEPMGRSGQWNRAYVNAILGDRRAVGEFQPRHRNKQPACDPLPNYYPPVVTEGEWSAAQAGVSNRVRRGVRGRIGEHVNIFTGLIKHARDGDDYYMSTRLSGRGARRTKSRHVLITRNAVSQLGAPYSFVFDVFEREILTRFREIDLHEVIGTDPGQDEVVLLSGELAHVQGQLSAIEEQLEILADVATLAKAARKLESRKRELAEKLAAARLKAAHPLGEAWGEVKTLTDLLDKTSDPRGMRLRLRALLRRVVDSIWLLVVPRGRVRLAVVQVWFTDDGRREYIIYHRPPTANGKGRHVEGVTHARDLKEVVTVPEDLDLRRRADAAELEADLLAVDLT